MGPLPLLNLQGLSGEDVQLLAELHESTAPLQCTFQRKCTACVAFVYPSHRSCISSGLGLFRLLSSGFLRFLSVSLFLCFILSLCSALSDFFNILCLQCPYAVRDALEHETLVKGFHQPPPDLDSCGRLFVVGYGPGGTICG